MTTLVSRSPAPDDPTSLRATIRQRLRRGTLFHAPHRIWAGRATGRSCVVCKTHISQRDLPNEIVIRPVTMWAHIGCYWIWHEESCIFAEEQERTMAHSREDI